MKKYARLLLIATLTQTSISFAQDSLRSFYNEGLTAFQRGDFSSYQQAFENANRLRPNHPTLTYHLARAYTLNNNPREALRIMKEIILTNNTIDFQSDSCFQSLTTSAGFMQIKALADSLSIPIQHSETFRKIDFGTLHPEGMAYNKKEGTFYFGGVHERKIVALDATGTVTDLISHKDHPEVFAVMGIEYDQQNDLLWFCTAALPEMKNYTDSLEGMSSVFAYEIKSGKLIKSEIIAGGNVFGDLTIDKHGTVYISDGTRNIIYTVSQKNKIEEYIDLSGRLWNLQGLAFTKDETRIYLSDYISGIYYLDTSTKALHKIDLPNNISDKGFDGLYFHNQSLIGIQNGTTPKKSWRLFLDESGTKIKQAQIIDQALEILNEPTQGAVIGNEFYYIANSPWAMYKESVLVASQLKPTIILVHNMD